MSQIQRWNGSCVSNCSRADMVPEIAAAVGFVSSLLRTRGCVSEQQLQVFSGALEAALTGERTEPPPKDKRGCLSLLDSWWGQFPGPGYFSPSLNK